MPEYKQFLTDSWNKFGKLGKALTIVAGVITAYTTVEPVITSTADKIHKIQTTQERIDKLQVEVDVLKKASKHQEEYIMVLDGIIDGVLTTYYHRGIRYGKTKKGDIYYHSVDSDNIKKWMRAIYTAEKDVYGYVDHNGNYNLIKPIHVSKLSFINQK